MAEVWKIISRQKFDSFGLIVKIGMCFLIVGIHHILYTPYTYIVFGKLGFFLLLQKTRFCCIVNIVNLKNYRYWIFGLPGWAKFNFRDLIMFKICKVGYRTFNIRERTWNSGYLWKLYISYPIILFLDLFESFIIIIQQQIQRNSLHTCNNILFW